MDSDILIRRLKNKWGFSNKQIKDLLTDDIVIPVSVLADRSLGPLEAVVRFLKDEKNLKYSEIARMLERDERTIWVTYNNAKKK